MVARTYTSLPPIVDIWFQFLFHSPSGVLFTFPSRYLCTIGHQIVFSLTQWSGLILTEFHVLHDTWDVQSYRFSFFAYKAVTFFGCPFQNNSACINKLAQTLHNLHFASHNTHITTHASLHDTGLGFSQFAHHYYGNHVVLFS